MVSAGTIHCVCIALVVTDQLARALRIRIITQALGHPIGMGQAVATNTIGDAACAITPMRFGGEPVRLAMLLRAGVPATATFVAIAFEVVTMWPVIITSAVAIALAFAPGWLESAGPAFIRGLGQSWSWLVGLAAVSVLIWRVVRRSVHVTPRLGRRSWHRVRVYWRRMPLAPLLAAGVLAFVNLVTRTAILPVLMLTLPDPPPLGPAVLGSFALLYSQLALPTPSGMGVVDLGLLAGAAGATGAGGIALLFWWRFYTSIVGVLLGGVMAVRVFGWEVVRTRLKGKGKGKEAGS